FQGVHMEKIIDRFNQHFAHFGVTFPVKDAWLRQRGYIEHEGWMIWYLFDSDEQGEYLDYYACHRMTSDTHIRIYADGRGQALPAIRDMRLRSKDPEEDARLAVEFRAN